MRTQVCWPIHHIAAVVLHYPPVWIFDEVVRTAEIGKPVYVASIFDETEIFVDG